MSGAITPLPWLAALLLAYLLAPIVAFVVRLGHGVASAPGVGGALLTSLLTATISTAIIALLGIPLAYLLARARGAVGAVLTVLVALPLALPPLISGILLLYLVGPYTALGRLFGGGLTDSRAGIVIAQTFVAAPFLVIAARGAFAAAPPALEDVARTLGHRRLARFARVALPVAWPGVQAGLLLAWLRAFGEFGATIILAYHPYSLPVFTFVQFDSTGLPSTVLPIAAALGAAALVLAAVQLHARRGRASARPPEPLAPPAQVARPLRFALRKRLGGFELQLEHVPRSFRLALLGPSGAGKTLTLRLLAGITQPDQAEIHCGDRPLGELPAEERGLGYLPQDSALLPRRTVWQQVTFAVDADPSLAAWWLERLGLSGLEDRLPEELSGGQRRRVALARALARGPSLMLLDEPFSGLDAPVRARLYRDLRRLQAETGLATVLVTHDPEEAALLADEMIVLDHGRALQQGPVAEVLRHPNSPAVAALLGIPNQHQGTVLRPGTVGVAGLELPARTGELAAGTPVDWAVRPEEIRLEAADGHRGTVLDVVALGAVAEVSVLIEDRLELAVRALGQTPPPPGSSCRIEIPPEAVMVWRRAPAELVGRPAGVGAGPPGACIDNQRRPR
jgi:ABC-type sulfate/molybdate transport systems ATPase subunit/ABC-type sulfate transport system permease component